MSEVGDSGLFGMKLFMLCDCFGDVRWLNLDSGIVRYFNVV